MVTKLNFMTKYTKAARNSFIKELEGYRDDIGEQLTRDTRTGFTEVSESSPIATTAQSHLANELIASHTTNINQLVVLHCPLMTLDSLLPNSIDLVRITPKKKKHTN